MGFPAAAYFTDSARTNSEAKQAQDDLVAATKQLPGAAAATTLTILSGAVTPVAARHLVDTEGAAAADNLDWLDQTDVPDGGIVTLSAVDSARVVTLRHGRGGSGQILLIGSANIVLDDPTIVIELERRGTAWRERLRSVREATLDATPVGDALMTAADAAAARAAIGVVSATDTASGLVELTTIAEGLAGTDTTRAVTPDVLAALWQKGTDIASATTLSEPSDANKGGYYNLTGTTTVNGMWTAPAGTKAWFRAQGILTLTHNATSFINLTGANITTAADDRFCYLSLGSGNWIMLSYERADGSPLVSSGWTFVSPVSASGSAVDFTGIPSGTNEIVVFVENLSLSGTDNILIQLGDSGGIETTGYVSSQSHVNSSGTFGTSSTSGFVVNPFGAGEYITGHFLFRKMTGNKWTCSFDVFMSFYSGVAVGGGLKETSAELDRVRVTRTGTNTFDFGTVGIAHRR